MDAIKRANRLISIDLMRGYFLLVIVIDHLGRFPNMLEWVSGRGALWVTAAEGFFFVSGLMLGLTAVRKIKDKGFWPVASKMWQRAGLLYILSVATTLIFTFISFRLGWAPKGGLIDTQDWSTIIGQTLTLTYAYGWADFLPRYALYMFLAPVAAYLLYRGMWWVVVWISLLVWAFIGASNFTYAWQIVFFLGMIAGYYLPQLREWANSWQPATQKITYISAIIASVSLLAISAVICLGPFILYDYSRLINPILTNFASMADRDALIVWLQSTSQAMAGYVDHERMGVGRIILFNLYFWTAFAVLQKHGQVITRWIGWLLLPMGKNSLLTYLVHAIVIFTLDVYVLRQPGIKWNMLHTVFAVGLVWSTVVVISNRAAIWSWLVHQSQQSAINHWLGRQFGLLSQSVKAQSGSTSKLVAVIVPLLAMAMLTVALVLRLLM